MATNSSIVLIDTSVIINFMHGKAQYRALFRELATRQVSLATSCISVAELYARMRLEEEATTAEILEAFEILPVTFEIAQKAGLMRGFHRRSGRIFALDDMMIAATSILYGYPLITDNRKDFEIPEIVLFPEF
jgi:predicted nucleic acid-binding protein